MIIVKLMGGLGNQMFQYAAGRRLALVHGTELKLDLGWFSSIAAIDTTRTYELGVFNIKAIFASPEEISRVVEVSFLSRLGRLNRLVPAFLKRGYIREKHYHYDPHILDLRNNVYLEGYWQCPRYFQEAEDIIRKEFSLRAGPDPVNRSLAASIEECESVSLHIRRGDYISNPATVKVHGICSPEYYQKAVDMLTQKVKKPHFFIFSDDPSWARRNMTSFTTFSVIDHNGPDKGHEDMRLMSLCKHHIIANSSFSWWGAWLCSNPDKIVIAPRQWFKDPKINTNYLVPDTWIRI